METKVIFEEMERLLRASEPFVLATIVRTKGAIPQKPGDKLLVRRDGTTLSELEASSVEAEATMEATKALKAGRALLREFEFSEEEAAQGGAVCAGTMGVLIDPISEKSYLMTLIQEILRALKGESAVTLATLIKPSQERGVAGAKLLIREDGSRLGSLGDGFLEDRSAKRAGQLMAYGAKELLTTERGEEVFIETYTTSPTILILGAGDLAKALYTLARPLGFRVLVVDDSPDFANKMRFPEADKVIAEDFSKAHLDVTSNTFIVVATRGHEKDDVALLAAVRTKARYVGMVGSKSHILEMLGNLMAQGISFERVKEIRAPIGLKLGGLMPADIALCILAEIQMVRFGTSGKPMKIEEELLLPLRKKARVSGDAERGKP
ncbi:MAG: XdhC family protein [Dehalococcoidia bacterium]